jgi:hypothetical protein
MRNKHHPSTHYGTSAGLTRKGKVVKQGDDQVIVAASIRRAKRFMRTGKEQRDE